MSVLSAASLELAVPIPCVRVFTETVYLERGAGEPDEELTAGVITLQFEYPGETRRDAAAERQARYLLESLGVVEIDCQDSIVVAPNSEADYLIQTGHDVQRLCEFSAYALPQLERLGWQVEVAPDYAWQTVSDPGWFANVSAPSSDADWFGLELGIVHEGHRVDLLPTLLELLDRAGSLDTLLRPGRKCLSVRVDDLHYVAIDAHRLRSVVAVMSEMHSVGSRPTLHRAGLVALGRLDEMVGGLAWECDEAIRELAVGFAAAPGELPTLTEPAELQATLRPYQRVGFAWLQHLAANGAGGLLADDMGLGKTLQTIAHLTAEVTAGRSLPALVVGPTSLVGNWRRELRRFAPHLSVVVLHGPRRHDAWPYVRHADVVITTYPVLVRDQERFAEVEFDTAVLDEAQYIKNPRSRAHRAACALKAKRRFCLTGTPVENNLDELWALFNFAIPGFLGSAQQFRYQYRMPIERAGATHRLDELRARCAPFILRRTKNEVARDLPSKTELVRAVELSGAQRDLYESIRMSAHTRVRKAIKKSGLAGSTIAILDALMKLRQVCCDPRLLRLSTAASVTESAKYALLFELLELQRSQGRRALVFSQFTSMLSLIGDGLREIGIPYLQLTGSSKDRQGLVDRFESGEADVFLISLKAGGTGLNLTSADTVIHYDPWWNPAAQAQATDRAYRIGQTKPVFVYNLIAAGSVEEKMLHLQRRKRRLAESILTHGARGLEESDVEDLFAPLPDQG